MEGLNQDLVSRYLTAPTNVPDGIKAGAFQGMGYLGRGPGIYLGDVWPYSICPNYSTTPLLNSDDVGTINGNSSIYLPLGSIPFSSFPGYVTLLNNNELSVGTCVKLDYERSLNFTYSNDCELIISSVDEYFQKTVQKYTLTGSGTKTLDPFKYLCSCKVTNQSSDPMTYTLSLGLAFGLPYNLLYEIKDTVKMILYDGDPMVTCENIPSVIEWLPDLIRGKDLYEPVTITTGFTRPGIDLSPAFADVAPFTDRPLNGERILTIYAQHYGFGNLPAIATPTEQKQFLNGNPAAILGLKPYSENFVPWFG